MKIIAWNCNMAFRKKANAILAHEPDLLVIPECEHPDKLKFNADTKQPQDVLWFGSNTNKGLGVFAYAKLKFSVLEVHNDKLQMIVPIEIKTGRTSFLLFAVWANNPNDPEGHYVEQVWKAIHCYDNLLSNKKVILAGDFNSNSIWDRPRRAGNHSAVVEYLGKKGIHSTYHHHFNQVQGKEQHPTQYMYRHKDKPYHLDYCFVSRYFSNKLLSVEIGDYDTWKVYSDHMPVISQFRGC